MTNPQDKVRGLSDDARLASLLKTASGNHELQAQYVVETLIKPSWLGPETDGNQIAHKAKEFVAALSKWGLLSAPSAEPSALTKEQIVELIRDKYDPAPDHYKRGDNWDDGAEEIADLILATHPIAPVSEDRRLVPVEPTEKMLSAVFLHPLGSRRFNGTPAHGNEVVNIETSKSIYKTMLNAAPVVEQVSVSELAKEGALALRNDQTWYETPEQRYYGQALAVARAILTRFGSHPVREE